MGQIYSTTAPGLFSRGPFPIPARRRIANQFHRLFSIKAGMRTVCVESPLEADAIYWAESDPNIIEVCEQPLRINMPCGKRPYFTFDISFKWASGNECFYEIKPESSMERSSNNKLIPKNWEVIQDICRTNAYTCQVLSDKTINEKSLEIANWRRLLPYARTAYESDEPWVVEMIIHVLKAIDKATIHQVFAQIPEVSNEKILSFLAKLIHQGHILANLNSARLTGMTTLSLIDNDD